MSGTSRALRAVWAGGGALYSILVCCARLARQTVIFAATLRIRPWNLGDRLRFRFCSLSGFEADSTCIVIEYGHS